MAQENKDITIMNVETEKMRALNAFIEDVLNRKIRLLKSGQVDGATVTFEDFKIKGSDIPQNKLPNNSEDTIELEKRIQKSNRILRKAYESILEAGISQAMEREIEEIFESIFMDGALFGKLYKADQELIRKANEEGITGDLEDLFIKSVAKEGIGKMGREELKKLIKDFCTDRGNLEKIVTKDEDKDKMIDAIVNLTGLFGSSRGETGENKQEPTKNEILEKYLSYQDTDLLDERKKSMLESTMKGVSAQKYAEALLEISRNGDMAEVERLVKGMKAECLNALIALKIEKTKYADSDSWAMWDIAKQYHFYTHPSENDPRYLLANPLESEEKIEEIIDRHIGWELYAYFSKNGVDVVNIVGDGEKKKKILDILTGEKNASGGISSFNLAVLGKLLKSEIPGFKHEKMLSVDGGNPDGKKDKDASDGKEEKKTKEEVPLDKNSLLEKGKTASAELDKLWKKLPDYPRMEPEFESVFRILDMEGENYFDYLCKKDEQSSDWKTLDEEGKNKKINNRVEHVETIRGMVKKKLLELGIELEDPKKKEKGADKNEGSAEERKDDGKKAEDMSEEVTERVKILKKEVEIARKEYLETDYRKKNSLRRIYAFLGASFKNKEEKTLEKDLDIAWHRAHYDNKLFDLQKVMLDDAKERGVSDKELAEIGIYFRMEQKINMAEVHDQVKSEQQDKKLSGFIEKKALELTDFYKTMPLGKKLLIAGVFLGGSVVTAGVGGAAAGAFITTATGRKMLMGMFAGVGVTLGLEARGKKSEKAAIEKEKAGFLESIKNMNEEEKYNFIAGNIKNISIKDGELAINKIKNQDIRQKIAGVSAGFAATVLPGIVSSYAGEAYAGILEKISPESVPAPPVMSEVVLEVKKGSSFEGTIIKHLSDPNSEIYKHHPELKNVDPGVIAHRLALDFAHDHGTGLPDLVNPDDRISIKFDPAALKINGTLEDSVRIDIESHLEPGKTSEITKAVPAEIPKVVPATEVPASPETPISEEKNIISKNNSRLESVMQEPQGANTETPAAENPVEQQPDENLGTSSGERQVSTEREATQENNAPALAVEKNFTENNSFGTKNGKIGFSYDKDGKITAILQEVLISGLEGNENLTPDFRKIVMETGKLKNTSMAMNIANMGSREVSNYMEAFEELKKGGHDKEARAVLDRIYGIVLGTEKHLGVKIFDRSKLPLMEK
ncbi:MAG TPA: hypothetical protein DCX32_01945 [Candidatus Moranbacteria bacterium]|nr:MAG: hypothetical protein UW87_C0004G0002 [Candidatus Moranbacteria bacterium GW2011_GWC2_45_10]KKT95460.1 MAG: hypothetical protein UW95_C0001G0024 [Parcubacteria group bacterium GW2011_GWC1_45_14]HAV11284.1 hypothetical protein [Candidatus Moranbacteria bacterium]